MAQAVKVEVDGKALPSELTGLKRSDELLWSEGTGRSAQSGTMTGSVVAQKSTYALEWAVLTAAQYRTVRSALGGDAGFFRLVVEVDGSKLADGTFYRGAVSGELAGVFGGAAYYRNVSAEVVER